MKLPLEVQKAPVPTRRPVFVFFMLLFGWITYHMTTPDHSVVGRIAGGLFIYALSITDAYKWARFRAAQYATAS